MTTPVLKTDGSVRFESVEELQHHYKTYLSQGSVMVHAEVKPAAFATLEVTLISAADERVKVSAQAIAFPGEEVLLRLDGFGPALDARLRQLAEPPPPAPATPVPATPEPPEPTRATQRLEPPTSRATQVIRVDLPPSGQFKNPATPEAFLALPLTHPATPAQLSAPSVPLLLQVIAARREPCVRLLLRSGHNREIELYAVEGSMLHLAKPLQSVIAALAEPEGTLEFSPATTTPAGHRYKVTTSAVLTAVIKDLVKHYVEPDLRAGMAGRMGLSPKQGARTPHVLNRLSLSDAQVRVAGRMLDGLHALDEVLYTGIGVRSTFQLLYLLEVWGGLEWVDPPPKENVLVDELKATLARARGADHFAVLGLHLSTPPRQIERAYLRLKEMYGPSGIVTRQSPQLAGELWTMIERSYQVIATAPGRKAYRPVAFPTVRLEYSADLTYAQAALAELREEWTQAIDLLDITLELHPTAEAVESLRRVRSKQSR